jgi:3-hydroxyisobutyrate dehydrogenase-like beta-hydroxyacid dehydrogenase
MPSKLAFLGLGNIGRGIAKNLVAKSKDAELPLILWNRTKGKADELSKQIGTSKTQVASTVEEAVLPSDIVWTCVGDDKADLAVYEAAMAVDVKGKLFVDCSTVHPETTDRITEMCKAAGAEFVACPVFGPPAAAEAGKLICVPSGPKASIDRLLPFTIDVIARENIIFADAPPSKSSLLKITGNTFILTLVSNLAEALPFAEKSGLGINELGQFIKLMLPGAYDGYFERMKNGDYYKKEPGFTVDLALKDANHAIKLAEDCGVKLQGVEVARGHLQAAKDIQGERADMASQYGAVRKESGLPYEV